MLVPWKRELSISLPPEQERRSEWFIRCWIGQNSYPSLGYICTFITSAPSLLHIRAMAQSAFVHKDRESSRYLSWLLISGGDLYLAALKVVLMSFLSSVFYFNQNNPRAFIMQSHSIDRTISQQLKISCPPNSLQIALEVSFDFGFYFRKLLLSMTSRFPAALLAS